MDGTATPLTGVLPCYKNQFQIGAPGAQTLNNIADMESFSTSFDDGIEEWSPFDQDGWKRRLKTAKSITISVKGKRNIGDAGNDFVASLIFKNGRDSECDFTWTFPDGTIVKFPNAIVNVKNFGSGDSTNAAPLEFDILSNGKPVITLAA